MLVIIMKVALNQHDNRQRVLPLGWVIILYINLIERHCTKAT